MAFLPLRPENVLESMLHLSKRQEVLLCLFDPVALVLTSVIALTVFYMLTSLSAASSSRSLW